jgi:hypothetical protein
MGFFERTHLSDQNSSALCRGPSRGLQYTATMESTAFCSGRTQGGRLQLRSRCVLEKSAMPSHLISSAKQPNPMIGALLPC